jgi:tryptophan synthase alpha chain
MTRIGERFAAQRRDGGKGLIIYITAGDPDIETTRRLVLELEQAGADLIELGVPFTEMLADGPSIQAASWRALASGTTLEGIYEMVRDLRRETQIPILLMTYYNPLFRRGLERVAAEAQDAGVDGFLVTDLPPEEAGGWHEVAHAHGLDTVFLLAPTSTEERIRIASRLSSGFLYCVSRTGVTGAREQLPEELHDLLTRIRRETDQPIAVGFGISRPEHVRQVTDWADGAVIGSAVVDLIARDGRESPAAVGEFVRGLRAGAPRSR